MSEFGRLGPSNFAGERPVLSENHIRTYWWCSPARIGMATMAPIQQFEAAQGVWSIGMSKGKISHFPAHHLRRNSIGQQYDRRRNWKRLMGAILRTGWSAISTCSAPCTARANACVQAVHSRPSSMLSPLQCKAPYTHSPRCISTGWKMLFARVWREGSSQSASSGHAMSPCRSSRASRAR